MKRLYKPKKLPDWDENRFRIRGIDGKIVGVFHKGKGSNVGLSGETVWKANLAVYRKRLARRKMNKSPLLSVKGRSRIIKNILR
jgi:hypothetical protein